MTGLAASIALLRGLHLAALLSLLGTAGFIAWMLPATGAVPVQLHRRLTRWASYSGAVALTAGAGWFILESASISDADDLAAGIAALPLVAMHTRFGHMLTLRLGILLLAVFLPATGKNADTTAPSLRPSTFLTLALTAIALSLQGFMGHAGASEGVVGFGLVLSVALHLLAAGLWLGALFPLWLGIRSLQPSQAASVCERFSPIGIGCVLVLAGTGFIQGLQLIGSVPGLLGTPYGRIALVKIALFLCALVLAAINGLRLTDQLMTNAPNARHHLLITVSLETLLGLAIITAAAFMACGVPAIHAPPG